ncbi:MAG: carbohydrate binding domain-containing protein [Fimbriimonas sp.]|nr:carbohydrate binding domain-containing protein [Fimbriimonas sp.]
MNHFSTRPITSILSIAMAAALCQAASSGPRLQERLVNGDFAKGELGWKFEINGAARGTAIVAKEGPHGLPAMKVTVQAVSDHAWHLQVLQKGIKFTKGNSYVMSFWGRADSNVQIKLNFQQNHEPWEHHGAQQEIRLTSKWQKFEYKFAGPYDDPEMKVQFTDLATKVGQTYWFSKCSLLEGAAK